MANYTEKEQRVRKKSLIECNNYGDLLFSIQQNGIFIILPANIHDILSGTNLC